MNDSELKGTELGELRGRLCWSNTQDALVVLSPLHPLFQFFFCPHLLFFFSRLWLGMSGGFPSAVSTCVCLLSSVVPHLPARPAYLHLLRLTWASPPPPPSQSCLLHPDDQMLSGESVWLLSSS